MQDQGEEADGVRRTELSSPIRDSSVQASGLRGPQHKQIKKKYKCNICDIEYGYLSGLSQHKKSVHEGVTYKCKICQYAATQKGSLKIHTRSLHVNDERYSCNICPYQATQKSSLSCHVKNVHNKNERVICTECYKSLQKDSLHLHRKLFHSGEQPKLSCKICTYKTICQSNLNKHIKSVHQSRK